MRIIENQARNDQIQMLTAETQMSLGEIRGVARIFPEVRTLFSLQLVLLQKITELSLD